jgi:Domain of unknown function (DUF4157)
VKGEEGLTERECAALGNLTELVDCARVRVYRSGGEGGGGGLAPLVRRAVLWASRGRAVALGEHVFLPDGCRGDLAVLAHELTHCGQYQAWGAWRYFTRGAAVQLRDLLHRTLGVGTSPYQYALEPGKPFHAYGMEQQAQIVEDCYHGDPRARAVSPFRPDGGSA